jgi:hypothetical protein
MTVFVIVLAQNTVIATVLTSNNFPVRTNTILYSILHKVLCETALISCNFFDYLNLDI